MHYTTKLGLPAPDDADPLGSIAQAVSDLAAAIDGTVPRAAAGRVTVNVPAVNTTYTQRINFTTAFANAPAVTATPEITPPDTARVSCRNVDTGGFDLVWLRTAGSTLTISWQAVATTQ